MVCKDTGVRDSGEVEVCTGYKGSVDPRLNACATEKEMGGNVKV